MCGLTGVDQAFVFGSWAARFSGEDGARPVQDIDLLVLGDPDRNELYERMGRASKLLGREVQVTIRDAGWITTGSGSFHDTVASRPLVPVTVLQSSDR